MSKNNVKKQRQKNTKRTKNKNNKVTQKLKNSNNSKTKELRCGTGVISVLRSSTRPASGRQA